MRIIPTFIEEKFNSKDVRYFNESTPEGNKIEGKILLNHGKFHGSLLIEKVNEMEAPQFIMGFPKINYIDKEPELNNVVNVVKGYEKLDGTCVGIYNLRDHNYNIIEMVPKSRQKAVLDEHFIEMLNYCDLRLLKKHNTKFDTIYFELFGMLNEHTLPHKNTYIDIRLIGAVPAHNKNKISVTMMSPTALEMLSELIHIPFPKHIVTIYKSNIDEHGMFRITTKDDYIVVFKDELFPEHQKTKFYGTLEGATEIIRKYLDKCNNTYKEEKGYLKYEGVVLQCNTKNRYTKHNTTTYVKVKPETFMEEFHSDYLTVPINEIRKEIRKIINENLTIYMESYDEKKVILEIEEYLMEEYSESDVKNPKVRSAIVRELHKYIDSISDEGINKIVDKIIEDNPDKLDDIIYLMRYFATTYPMRKHQTNHVYYVLEKRLKKLNVN